jgi:hypothetical protein
MVRFLGLGACCRTGDPGVGPEACFIRAFQTSPGIAARAPGSRGSFGKLLVGAEALGSAPAPDPPRKGQRYSGSRISRRISSAITILRPLPDGKVGAFDLGDIGDVQSEAHATAPIKKIGRRIKCLRPISRGWH